MSNSALRAQMTSTTAALSQRAAIGVVGALALAGAARGRGGSAADMVPRAGSIPSPVLTGDLIRNVVGTRAALQLLDQDPELQGSDWGQGGCGILAAALLGIIPGSTLYALRWQGRPQHYLVRAGGFCYDYDGAAPMALWRRRWETEYPEMSFALGAELVPVNHFDPMSGIPANHRISNQIERMISLAMKSPTSGGFREWFKNSAVVNEDGTPKVVYHGGPEEFDVFDFSRAMDIGAHLGTREAAGEFGRPRAMYVSIQRPIELDDPGDWIGRTRTGWFPVPRMLQQRGIISQAQFDFIGEALQALKDSRPTQGVLLRDVIELAGYDGIMYKNRMEDVGSTSYIAFRPKQIKLALGDLGTYASRDPRMSFNINATPGEDGA